MSPVIKILSSEPIMSKDNVPSPLPSTPTPSRIPILVVATVAFLLMVFVPWTIWAHKSHFKCCRFRRKIRQDGGSASTPPPKPKSPRSSVEQLPPYSRTSEPDGFRAFAHNLVAPSPVLNDYIVQISSSCAQSWRSLDHPSNPSSPSSRTVPFPLSPLPALPNLPLVVPADQGHNQTFYRTDLTLVEHDDPPPYLYDPSPNPPPSTTSHSGDSFDDEALADELLPLECPICYEDMRRRSAVGAACGHVLCRSCRERIIRIGFERGELPTCHACRMPYDA